ncbi:MAG: transposase [Opitutales bacterium]
MSRTVNGEHLFGDREKEMLRCMIWQVADFSGVEVVTHSEMGNHFHVLIRVPEAGELSDAELMRRYQRLYPQPTKHQQASIRVLAAKLKAGGEEAEAIRARLLKRMHDVSEFMKTLKQRFSTWFNAVHKRFGPLWADRFKSVVVESERYALETVAAYIDLNSVRAGLAEDPKKYRFCGYAEALAGSPPARAGIASLFGLPEARALEEYRMLLFGKGSAPVKSGASLPEDLADRVLKSGKGQIPLPVRFGCKIRYFTEGIVFGSVAFVRDQLEGVQKARGRKRLPFVVSCIQPELENLAVAAGMRGKPEHSQDEE